MISNLNNDLNLNGDQFCYNLESGHPCGPGGYMKMYVPKLMSDIGFDKPKSEVFRFNPRGIFSNSSECMFDISSSINCVNYINIKLDFNNNDFTRMVIDKWGRISSHNKFICKFINGNVDRGIFTTSIV